MKVAIISSAYHPYTVGGGERSAQELAENLRQRGTEVFVIAAHDHDQRDVVNGVPVYRIRSPNVYWSYRSDRMPFYKKLLWHTLESYNPRTLGRVLPILEQERPDVLQIRNFHNFSAAIWRAGRPLGIPVVQTLNDYTSVCYRITMFRHHRVCPRQCTSCRVMTWPRRYLSRYVDRVVAVSAYTLRAHERAGYFPNAPKTVVHTTPTTDKVVALPLTQRGFVTFGFIGRLHPNKGAREAIEAFRQAEVAHDQLIVAGDGPADYLAQCRQAAGGHPRIHFVGKVASSTFYPRVDVVIIPSLWGEPFPRVVPESYTYRRPVVVSDRGGSAEAVTPDTGYVFSADNFATLRAVIRELSQHPARIERMSAAIGSYFSTLPDAQRDVRQYLKVYQDATEQA